MIEDYINDMNMAEVISGSIKVLIEENEELQERINKAIHLINHNDILDYRVFEKLLLDILEGTSE